MPPRPTQNSRAGFRSNPISDQVEFDKEAAPATVGPRRPKPKSATFAEPPRQAQTLQVPSRVQREAPRQRQQLQSNRYDESHDDDPESDEEEETVVDEDHYAQRRSAPPPRAQPIRQQYAAPPPPRPTASAAYARSSPAPQQRQYQSPQSYYPPHAHQLQHRQAPHGFSSLADEPEDEGIDSDDDAFTAVGTGVATDLSLDDDEAIPMGRGRLGYEQPYAQTQQRGGQAPRGAGGYAAPAPQARRQQQYVAEDDYDDDDPAPPPPPARQLAPPPTLRRPSSSTALRSTSSPRPTPIPDLPQDSLVEKELIQLLKEMNFSVALKDLHDHLGLGVQKTLVAEDGMGHAYCKVHCKVSGRSLLFLPASFVCFVTEEGLTDRAPS